MLKRFQKQDLKPKKPSSVFVKYLGHFSVFRRKIENYLRNLIYWEKSKNRFGLGAPKLSKNC
jgi:hypothetical protein